ncbi:hypothetical protein HDR63_04185 [bacterium]|nr:hypothetical protein [bacterium]
MNQKTNTIASKLLNLYRQQHVIFGGWAAVNRVFVAEAAPDVMDELRTLPTGKLLARHIENLRAGRTPMDSIERDLLPYGGMMADTVATIPLTPDEWAELETGIDEFTPDQAGLTRLQSLRVVKKFGDEWLVGIRAALTGKPALLDKWAVVTKTWRAYYLWKVANDLLDAPLSDRSRAQLQADMPEYETYLPMFGDAGNELLGKLRTFVSSIKEAPADRPVVAPTDA